MNFKRLFLIGVFISGVAALAVPPRNLKPGDGVYGKDGKKLTKEEVRAILYRRNGGKLKVPGIQKGVVNYVICDNAVNSDWVRKNAAAFERVTKIDIDVVNGSFDFPNPKILGNASLFIVNKPELPSLLIAPEQKWALVNVATLKQGRGEKAVFYEARVQKELTRGFAMLCGASSSNYPQSLTGCVTKPDDLDRFPDCRLPVDITARFEEYLSGYGVVPYKLMTYRQACQEGWAPAPTNDIQKAIWDKVRSVPKNPMKIEFDPKKGR